MCVQMASLVNFTKLPKSLISEQALDALCKNITAIDATSRSFMRLCFPDVMKKVNEMCSGDGKGDKGDGKDDDKGDGKGDDKQNPMCAQMADSVCPRCVYVQVAG